MSANVRAAKNQVVIATKFGFQFKMGSWPAWIAAGYHHLPRWLTHH